MLILQRYDADIKKKKPFRVTEISSVVTKRFRHMGSKIIFL